MEQTERLKLLLDIHSPFVQGPMLGVSTPQLAAAVSNHNGLGSVAAGCMSPQETREQITRTKRLTGKPFAVNLFADRPEPSSGNAFIEMFKFLKAFCGENGIPYHQQVPQPNLNSYQSQLGVLIKEKVKVISFTFGILEDEDIYLLKNCGIKLIGTATSVQEAKLLEKKGIDVVIAQGMEAGGHRGSFLTEEPLIGNMSLIPHITDSIKVPVLAAGGIAGHRSFKAAMSLGASGVVSGSAFIFAEESLSSGSYKDKLRDSSQTDIILTRAFSGKWARAVRNNFILEIEKSNLQIPSFREQLVLTSPIRLFGAERQRPDLVPMWGGQSAPKSINAKAVDIMDAILLGIM
jgi:nitronate monooxygenase